MGRTDQQTTIAAPAEKVWKALRDFHDVSWSGTILTKCKPVGEIPGNKVGAKRILNDAFHETLLELNDSERVIRYSIDDGPPAVSKDTIENYVGVIRVTDQGDGSTQVNWSSSWEKNDDETAEFCRPIYVALLADLKASLE